MSLFFHCSISLLIPYPSVQHFIWPLHWCLLADICNHTYIPECGTQNEENKYDRRLFIDECDLFEYNCDYETDFYPINYSSCFNLPQIITPCPPIIPCPSIPPCPDHSLHNTSTTSTGFELVSKFKNFVSKFPVKKPTLGFSLPIYMLRGKRRYSPTPRKKKKKKQTTKRFTVKKTITKKAPSSTKTKMGKNNGRKFNKAIKAIVKKNPSMKKKVDSDFLE